MPGIGSSISSAAKAAQEAVVKPTADTIKASVAEGIIEPILGTPTQATNNQPTTQPQPTTATPPKYSPAQRQNVANFLNAMAAQDQASRERHQQEANLKQQQEAETKKQTEIRQIEIKKAKREQMLNRAVFEKQRVEIKKGGS